MAADIYEYTDAQGRVHRVDSLSKVPKDRLRHMLVIGADDAAAAGGAPAASVETPAAAPAPKAGAALGPEVWGVSAVLMAVGLFNKRFLLRVVCIAVSVIWLLYNGYDVFMASDLGRTAEREPRKPAAAPPPE